MLIDHKGVTCLIEATGKFKRDKVTHAEFSFGYVNIGVDRTILVIFLQLIACLRATMQIHGCDYICYLHNFIIKVDSYVLSFVSFKTAL